MIDRGSRPYNWRRAVRPARRLQVAMLGGRSLPLSACALLVGAWLLATLTFPFGWDQGIFAWVGAVVRDGGLPYRDAVDLKGPLPYCLFASVQAVFGTNTWGIRLFDATALVAAAMALRGIVNRLWIVVGAVDGARLSLERRLAMHPSLASIIESRYCLEVEVGHYVLFGYCQNH